MRETTSFCECSNSPNVWFYPSLPRRLWYIDEQFDFYHQSSSISLERSGEDKIILINDHMQFIWFLDDMSRFPLYNLWFPAENISSQTSQLAARKAVTANVNIKQYLSSDRSPYALTISSILLLVFISPVLRSEMNTHKTLQSRILAPMASKGKPLSLYKLIRYL